MIRLIVTRPATQEQPFVSQLESLVGESNRANDRSSLIYKVDHLPLIVIEPHAVDILTTTCSQWDGVIFISKNAVNHLKSQLTQSQWFETLARPLYTVGKATACLLATELKQLRIIKEVVYPDEASTEGLLLLEQLNTLAGQNWLIVKGLEGRKKLRDEMVNRQARVTELDVYKRNAPSREKQNKIKEVANTNAVWIITSAQALKNLNNALDGKVRGCQVITSSDRISKIATAAGFEHIAQSSDATDAALVQCVTKLLPALGK